MRRISMLFLLFAAAAVSLAQLAAPNDAGISMGHVHLWGRDAEAQLSLWVALGSKPVMNGGLQMIQFPNVYIVLTNGEGRGGTVGSLVDHLGFRVNNLREARAKWQVSGLRELPGARKDRAVVMMPSEVRIDVSEDRSLSRPIVFADVGLASPAPEEMQDWYLKMFGATQIGPFTTER